MQFCYWLHGYFEINNARDGDSQAWLNKSQLEVVRRHAELVEDKNPWTCNFISWLNGVIDCVEALDPGNSDLVTLSMKISEEVAKMFDNVTSEESDTLAPIVNPIIQEPPPINTYPHWPNTNPQVYCTNRGRLVC